MKISYHYITSVSAHLTDIKYVKAVRYKDTFFLDILTIECGTDWLSQNTRTELPLYAPYNDRRERSQNMFNCSVSFRQENDKWLIINVFWDIPSKNA